MRLRVMKIQVLITVLFVEILTAGDQYPVIGGRFRRRFHFEACWADRDNCQALISKSWILSDREEAMGRVVGAISNCGQQPSIWNARNWTALRSDIKRVQDELR
ncbi:hypothetical protein QYF36_011142 [Acer negundo]|nr:hypothetical protein QYF36_011142 [Acer negundo]